jgi:predicted dinucleotide-binding enzyme
MTTLRRAMLAEVFGVGVIGSALANEWGLQHRDIGG